MNSSNEAGAEGLSTEDFLFLMNDLDVVEENKRAIITSCNDFLRQELSKYHVDNDVIENHVLVVFKARANKLKELNKNTLKPILETIVNDFSKLKQRLAKFNKLVDEYEELYNKLPEAIKKKTTNPEYWRNLYKESCLGDYNQEYVDEFHTNRIKFFIKDPRVV
jgi:uncharacterized protein YdcH (DUF465 family)